MAFHLFAKPWLSRVFTNGVNVIKKKSDEIILPPLTNCWPWGHKLAGSQPRSALAAATHSLPRFRRRKCMSSHLLLRTDTNGRPDNQFSAARYSQRSRLIHWVVSWVFAFSDDNISLASSVQSTQKVGRYWDNFPYSILRCQMHLSSFPQRLILSHSLWRFSVP